MNCWTLVSIYLIFDQFMYGTTSSSHSYRIANVFGTFFRSLLSGATDQGFAPEAMNALIDLWNTLCSTVHLTFTENFFTDHDYYSMLKVIHDHNNLTPSVKNQFLTFLLDEKGPSLTETRVYFLANMIRNQNLTELFPGRYDAMIPSELFSDIHAALNGSSSSLHSNAQTSFSVYFMCSSESLIAILINRMQELDAKSLYAAEAHILNAWSSAYNPVMLEFMENLICMFCINVSPGRGTYYAQTFIPQILQVLRPTEKVYRLLGKLLTFVPVDSFQGTSLAQSLMDEEVWLSKDIPMNDELLQVVLKGWLDAKADIIALLVCSDKNMAKVWINHVEICIMLWEQILPIMEEETADPIQDLKIWSLQLLPCISLRKVLSALDTLSENGLHLAYGQLSPEARTSLNECLNASLYIFTALPSFAEKCNSYVNQLPVRQQATTPDRRQKLLYTLAQSILEVIELCWPLIEHETKALSLPSILDEWFAENVSPDKSAYLQTALPYTNLLQFMTCRIEDQDTSLTCIVPRVQGMECTWLNELNAISLNQLKSYL